MKKLAVGSWSFLFNQEQPVTDFHDLVHHVGNLGYDGIELGGFPPHPNADEFDTREKRQSLRKLVVDHGLEFSALAADLWAQKLVSVGDSSPYLAAFAKHLAFADDLGIKTIRIDTAESIAGIGAVDARTALDRAVVAFDRCAKLALDRGIAVSWEFDPAFPLHQPAEILEVIERVRGQLSNPNFGILFNTCHAEVCGGALELLGKLNGKINHLHLIDSDGTLNEHGTSKRLPFGKGRLDFDKLAPALLTCGVSNDWWCVDLCFWPNAWEAAGHCRRFLDKLRRKFET
jgi:sugar phosphate isomerase/epimerase